MAVLYANFIAKYPMFENLPEPRFDLTNADAVAELDPEYFGDRLDYATEQWIGWQLLRHDRAKMAVTGPLTSKGKDGESWGFSPMGEFADEFEKEFNRVKRMSFRGGSVIPRC